MVRPAETDDRTAHQSGLNRRRFLRGTATAGTLLLGMGTAGASGQGGQAIVRQDDFEPDGSFEILEYTGPFQPYNCGQRGIALAGWTFRYVDDDDDVTRTLYTRDDDGSGLRTGVEYHWTGQNEKRRDCDPESTFVQTGYSAGNGT